MLSQSHVWLAWMVDASVKSLALAAAAILSRSACFATFPPEARGSSATTSRRSGQYSLETPRLARCSFRASSSRAAPARSSEKARSTAARQSIALLPKWYWRRPRVTPARRAMSRVRAPSKPFSEKASRAASRIRPRASGSVALGEGLLI